MHTLYDFISEVNAMQYLLAVVSVAGFIIFIEIFKPKPFKGLSKMIAEDVGFVKEQGKGNNIQLVKNAITGSAYAALYIISIPLLFLHGVSVLMSRLFTLFTYIGWSPVRAYFAGKKGAKKSSNNQPGANA